MKKLYHDDVEWVPKKDYDDLFREFHSTRILPECTNCKKLEAKLWVANDSQLRTYDGLSDKANIADDLADALFEMVSKFGGSSSPEVVSSARSVLAEYKKLNK